jgi:hypothetical protein
MTRWASTSGPSTQCARGSFNRQYGTSTLIVLLSAANAIERGVVWLHHKDDEVIVVADTS